VFAQIGPSSYRPRCIEWAQFIDADQCGRRVAECELVIAHAGMGSVITAVEANKPIVVVPRRASLGEHRNEHQVATAKHLARERLAFVAWEESDLAGALKAATSWRPADVGARGASVRLIGALRSFIRGDEVATRRPRGVKVGSGRGSSGWGGGAAAGTGELVEEDDLGVLGTG
jgi:UDP-N-acetylglucosamine transferase subunit ALG13